MLRSLLIGLVAGMRSLTPLAAVSLAARRDALPDGTSLPALLGHPLVTAGTVALAAGELAGDKMTSAPDRIVVPGMLARIATGAVAGAALAPRDERPVAAVVGAASAVASAYVTFDARVRAMRRYGQVPTGLVEDVLVVAAAAWIVGTALRVRR